MRDDDGAAGTAAGEPVDFAAVARLLPQGYPQRLIDRVTVCEAGRLLVARKGVTAGEPFFAGHFPGRPVMPGVLMCEALAQASALLVARSDPPPAAGATLAVTGLERVRFRQPVVPGDTLEIEVAVAARTPAAWRFRGRVRAGGALVAETDFDLAVCLPAGPAIHPTAVLAPGAALGVGVRIGPYAVVGAHVQIGDETTVGAHAVLDGRTTIGAGNRIFQFASVGAEPQDLKYRGEPSRLVLGDRNIVREFATLNPGTAGGGMLTRLGDDNLVMNYAHVGHDSQIGNRCILANSSALAGHVTLEDFVLVGGLAAVHQFCRIGESALLGGGAMVTHDVPPFCNASGDRARLRGLNVVGLRRRGFDAARLRVVKRAYRLLFDTDLPLAEARSRVAEELGSHPDVARMLDFIAASKRGLCPAGRAEDDADVDG
ncbi:MAG: acyl-[acyl-carrier-protein]--UDP-N-acetylglucosamine O-acyltransferase [Polyangiaceae bacterium UTPRO1]|jgi:UDP-N-acetylglucosamine acyltransferase|nr:acyl-ACP--UDP-N-acetylglucosamine O-acyltransferase [Myxococcales bacterium]OQY68841.1 MAG: acyl-[acyl-carrier-protein]--UDP-N-acetylglucosamine O-acyltransferase [Polyangiaceae bacterium UTPRO1]